MRALTPQTIFVSHATPSDNYFVTWLSSKLKLLGYSVWVELDELKLGDAFWPEIENVIRNQACKFLAVVSKSYLEKITDSVSGVFKELSCADRIKDIKSFKKKIQFWKFKKIKKIKKIKNEKKQKKIMNKHKEAQKSYLCVYSSLTIIKMLSGPIFTIMWG